MKNTDRQLAVLRIDLDVGAVEGNRSTVNRSDERDAMENVMKMRGGSSTPDLDFPGALLPRSQRVDDACDPDEPTLVPGVLELCLPGAPAAFRAKVRWRIKAPSLIRTWWKHTDENTWTVMTNGQTTGELPPGPNGLFLTPINLWTEGILACVCFCEKSGVKRRWDFRP